MKLTLASLSSVILLIMVALIIFRGILFNQQCGGYLQRAANANTPEIAINELDVALGYLERNNLTTGYTSIIYKTPSDDLGFFYSNLKQAREELSSLDSTSSNLEKSNVLIKLRETILDHGDKGDVLALANGTSRYPYNALIAIVSWVSLIVAVTFWIIILNDEDYS